LSVTIDYYDIEVTDAIDDMGAQVILDECLTKGQAFFCDLINRGSGGTLWIGNDNIINTDINTGFEKRSGIDLNVSYILDLNDYGSIQLSGVATQLTDYETQPVAGGETNLCDGKWGSTCEAPKPDLVANFKATWASPYDLNLVAQLRYIAGVDADTDERPDFGSQNYVDLTAFYDYKSLKFRLGAKNIFDRTAPIAGNPPTGNGNTYPGVYDAVGRFVFLGVSAEL
jgi:hypothetical protein